MKTHIPESFLHHMKSVLGNGTDYHAAQWAVKEWVSKIERKNGETLFREWSGNSYEWDALTDLERQRWNRLAEK